MSVFASTSESPSAKVTEPPAASRPKSQNPAAFRTLASQLDRRELRFFLRAARRRAGVDGEVTLLLSTDARLRRLNAQYRKKDQPTDVLSFPPARFDQLHPSSAGDLAISLPTASRQAREHGHDLQTEVKILLLHGLLHLAGHDHETDHGEMDRREAELRRHFRLPPGLIQRAQR